MKGSVQIIAFVTLFFIACQPVPKTVHLTGSIDNTTAEKVKLTSDMTDLELDLVDGKFSTQFDLEKEAYFNLRVGRESTTFYLKPGQTIDIYIDTEEFDESVKYTGEGSEAASYLAAKYLENEKNGVKREDLYKMEEAEFLGQLASTEKRELAFLEENMAGLSSSFIDLEKVNIAFGQKNHLLSYEPAHAYYAKKEGFEATRGIKDLIDKVDLNQAKNIGSNTFSNFLTSVISREAYEKSTTDEAYKELKNHGMLKASMDLITSKISDKAVRSYALDKIIKQTLSYSSALGLEPLMEGIKAITSNQRTFDLIDKSLEEWGHLAEGSPAPNFDGMTVKGEPVELSDLKGKNVYIDVWATWCGPCIREQPALFALEEEYKNNKNLAFMGVSIDSDKEAWTKMVSEKDMKGEQIFTEGAWKSSICNDYLIKGIPRFILIAKDGTIIDSDAPRPSSDAIKDILKDLSGAPLLSSL